MVRFAERNDLDRVNELRSQVHQVHACGRPDIFKSGFACVTMRIRPETPFFNERRFYDVEEFGVDEAFRRQGVGTELFAFIRKDAKKRGFDRVELNMWEFNEGALAFYEAVGFKTYRRYMEFELE